MLLRLLLYFNSIKVQLELNFAYGLPHPERGFQFHKGTIRTLRESHEKQKSVLFQFHKGTIRTCQLRRS